MIGVLGWLAVHCRASTAAPVADIDRVAAWSILASAAERGLVTTTSGYLAEVSGPQT